MTRNYFSSGEWNLTCDVCSKKIKSSEAKQRWDGLIVCPNDFEHRHQQDFIKARVDKITVPFTRPIPPIVTTGIIYQMYIDSGYWADDYILETLTL